jgi:hypothetical protein
MVCNENDQLAEIFILVQLSHADNENRKQQQQHAIGHREPQCVLIPPFITGTNLCPQCRNNLM